MYQQNVSAPAASADAADVVASLSAQQGSGSMVRQLRSVVDELVVALASTLNDQRDSAQQSLSRAVALLRAPEEPRTQPANAKGGLAPWQIRKVALHVDSNLDKPIRSSALATAVRLDPCYFTRLFRTTFGESPLRYVTKRRIERAQNLMLSTNWPLSQIALDCGFADQAHFSRLFRRIAGDSPRAWRRARMNGDEVRVRDFDVASTGEGVRSCNTN